MRNMASKVVGNLGISVHTANNPSNEEWAEMVEQIKHCDDLSQFKGISFTDGGSPTATQRKQTNEVLAGRAVPSAVVTSSAIARSVVTAMSWFNPAIKVFPPERLDDALRYLMVRESEYAIIKMELRKLVMLFGSQRILSVPTNL